MVGAHADAGDAEDAPAGVTQVHQCRRQGLARRLHLCVQQPVQKGAALGLVDNGIEHLHADHVSHRGMAQQPGCCPVGVDHHATPVQHQCRRQDVEQLAVARLRAGLRGTGMLLGGDIARHAPVAAELAAGAEPGLGIQPEVRDHAVALPPGGQVAQRLACLHGLRQLLRGFGIQAHIGQFPGPGTGGVPHRHEVTTAVAPGGHGQPQVGIGFPVGRGGHAQQPAEPALAAGGGLRMLAQRVGHGVPHHRPGQDDGAVQHQALWQAGGRCGLLQPAHGLGASQARHHRQSHPGGEQRHRAGPQRMHHAHGHAEEQQARCLQAPAAADSHQRHHGHAAQHQRRQRAGRAGCRQPQGAPGDGRQGAEAHQHRHADRQAQPGGQQRHGHRAQQAHRQHHAEEGTLHAVLQRLVQIDRAAVGGHSVSHGGRPVLFAGRAGSGGLVQQRARGLGHLARRCRKARTAIGIQHGTR